MTDKTYECVICYSINSAANLHCSTCGTIPAAYSPLECPTRYDESGFSLSPNVYLECVAAHGCYRQFQSYSYRSKLHTVSLDYYSDSENE